MHEFIINNREKQVFDVDAKGQFFAAILALRLQAQDLQNMIFAFNHLTQDSSASAPELVDIAYCYKQISEQLDNLRKECNARHNKISETLAEYIVQEYVENPAKGDKIKGSLATGTAKPKIIPIPPKKGTPEYEQFCTAFGISELALEEGLASVHYVNLTNYLERIAAEGRNPPFVLQQIEKATMSYRGHRIAKE